MITSEVIASGTISVVLDVQVGSKEFPLLSGRFDIAFPDARFSARGTVSANLDAPNSNTLALFFSTTPVPCPSRPGDPGDIAQQPRVALMTIDGRHARGDYIALTCPSGTIDLEQR